MTDIVPAPDIRPSSEFPTNADRSAGVFNSKVTSWADTSRTMAADMDAASKATRTNAVAAQERAQAAEQSRAAAAQLKSDTQQIKDAAVLDVSALKQQAETAAGTAATQADQAMGYRNTAGAHAETARLHKEAAAGSASAAADAALFAQQQAARSEAAAASISDGPLTSFNGRTGVVTLLQDDVKAVVPEATTAEMQTGSQAALRLMSPSGVAAAIASQSKLQRVARTANTQLITTDSGRWIDITAGTFTQTFLAPAALGAGWWCDLRNSGTGDITIPASDGRTNWIMYPGEVRRFQCDGADLRSIVLNAFYKVFAASGTFLKPPGYSAMSLLGWPGGNGGGGGGRVNSGAGGKGGDAAPATIPAGVVSASTVVTIGAGGSGSPGWGTSGGAPGGTGGATSFGQLYVAQQMAFPGAGYVGGLGGSTTTSANGSDGGSSLAGGGGGGGGGGHGAPTSYPGGNGGTSGWAGNGGTGGAGGNSETNAGMTPGNAGNAPGGGGGGGGKAGANSGAVGAAGGEGARGELRIWGVI